MLTLPCAIERRGLSCAIRPTRPGPGTALLPAPPVAGRLPALGHSRAVSHTAGKTILGTWPAKLLVFSPKH